jgi:hypothetical protein
VIVPAQTHVATVHAVEYVGATPVFVDCDRVTGNVDPVAKKATAANSAANGNPDKNLTCVAPRVPSFSVKLRWIALRPACAAAAKIEAGIHNQVQSCTVVSC